MKTVKQIAKIALPLTVICVVCACLLALVNGFTSKVISANEMKKKEEAVKNLVDDFKSFEVYETEKDDGVNEVYLVTKNDGTKVFCVDVTSVSKYGGDVNMMVSVSADGEALDAQVISHSETFISKYTDSNGKYTKIDCISGATYSYNAISDAMKIASEAVKKIGG